MSSSNSSKIGWVDAAKGIAILLVVLGHSLRGLNSSGIVPSDFFNALDSRIYAFHMPVFFALSGLFFARSLRQTRIAPFLWQRMLRLAWPLVLWTYLFLGVKIAAGGHANTPATLSDLLVLPFPGILHLWFLWALLLIHIGFAATRPLLQENGYPTLALCLFAGIGLAVQIPEFPQPVAHWAGPALQYMVYFVLGLILGQSPLITLARPVPGWTKAASLVLFGGLLFIWPLIPAQALFGLARPLGSLALTLAFLVMLAPSTSPPWPGLAAFRSGLIHLGKASMAIYLCHTIFSAFLRSALLGMGVENLWFHLIAGTLIGVIMPLVALKLARRAGLSQLLGF